MTVPSGDSPLLPAAADGAGKGDGVAESGLVAGITPGVPGPLPGERVGTGGGPGGAEIPFATEGAVSEKEAAALRKQAAKSARRAVAKARNEQLELADAPLWSMPEEVGGGRTFLATMLMLVVIGLYAWMLSFFYAGAHGGTDQAAYLMTARLLTGERNIDGPLAPAKPVVSAAAVHVEAATTKVATTATASEAGNAPLEVWAGGASGYTAEHPAPKGIQVDARWDWLRNRLGFVPGSPFQFASQMCMMTEPFGPALADVPPKGLTASAPRAASGPSGTQPAVEKVDAANKPAEYRFFEKYPFGFPLIAAVGREIDAHFDKQKMWVRVPGANNAVGTTQAGAAAATTPATRAAARDTLVKQDVVGQGFAGMYIVNPVCTVLACFFAYFMYRQTVSPFMALIGVIWLACNPLVLAYSNDANSHSSTLLCVSLGFWALISFLRTKKLWRAWVAGLALGYAGTIRYSEILLVLPVLFVAVLHFRWRWKRAVGSMSLLAAWAIPVAVLALTCWISFGAAWKTGYAYCNEDTGFGWKYLSGNWGDRQLTGNWETLVTQMNRTGLFVMWPLALAGIFGMIGAAWRLGGILALWVFPSMALYMLYYWAPGGETATAYLRFFVSVMPGLIFAGVWVLERALAGIKGEKWAGLAAGTVLGLGLLVVLAIYADGGPVAIDGGLGKMMAGVAGQMPGAVWRLMDNTKVGFACAMVILAAVAGMWLFDGRLVGSRMGVALGAGAITALGCAINLYTIVPQMESSFVRWTTLRVIVDNMREVLPRGSVVFGDENLLNQLDCVGGWKLYNNALFTPAMYLQSKTRVDSRAKGDPEDPDPNPLQIQRSRFYMELLAQRSKVSGVVIGPRNIDELRLMEKAIVDENIAEGHRVTFLTLGDAGDMAGGGVGSGGMPATANVEGYERVVLRKWTVSPEPSWEGEHGAAGIFKGHSPGGRGSSAATQRATPGGRGAPALGVAGAGGAGGIVTIPPVPSAVPRKGATYVLYELVKKGV